MGAQSEGRSPPFFARLLKEMQYTRCRKRLTTQAISLRNIALPFLSPDDAIVKKTLAGFTLLILVYSLLWLLRQTEAQPSARLRAELRDPSTGRALPGRFYLTDEQGNFKSPPGAVTYQKGAEQHFLADGSFELQLAPGRYSLAAERGPEFLPVSLALRLSSGEERKETLSMKRWIDMNRLGWYSGDLHNHRNVAEIRQLLLAEDLNLAPTLADWVWEDRERSTPPQAAQPVQPVDEIHVFSVLDKEVERLENGPGAVDLLGLKSPIPFQGYRLFPPNDTFCAAAHRQGGYVDAEKILWRDVAALVALGHIDFAGIVYNHFNRHSVELETDRWGMIPKYRPEFGTVAGMPVEHGRLLSLAQLRLSACRFRRERLGCQGFPPGIQPRVCEGGRTLWLRPLVSVPQRRPELCHQRPHAVPDGERERARVRGAFGKGSQSQNSCRGSLVALVGPAGGALSGQGDKGGDRVSKRREAGRRF